MIYTDFKDIKLSQLGLGCMRLPLKAEGQIDEEETAAMVRYASEHGLNYYDTAYPYHNCLSEIVIGKALKQLDRKSYYLATKYPGHQISDSYDPAATFAEQLRKCDVEYFDFYLMHNVYENSLSTYLDPRWGIVDYFIEQKKAGRIRHLGFSTHGSSEIIEKFLEQYGYVMEFCQIQLNYVDWTLQQGREVCELLNSYNIPIWVMEPLRGGKLAYITDQSMEKLRQTRPEYSAADWGFRFLQDIPGVQMILSGMSSLDQLKQNINAFSSKDPLSDDEKKALLEIAEDMKDSVPCTACGYCLDSCPQKINIPKLLSLYNDIRFASSFTTGMIVDSFDKSRQPQACQGCGRCSAVCPQKIDIPEAMDDFAQRLSEIPHWADLCKQREEDAKKVSAGLDDRYR